MGPGAVLVKARASGQAVLLDHQRQGRTHPDGAGIPRAVQDAAVHHPDDRLAKTKRPFHFQPKVRPFAFGVYDRWKGDGREIISFSIVTTATAPSTVEYHGRMPLVLEESQLEDWMREPPERAAGMMKPYAGAIDVWQVPSDVGNVRNNRPDLMERVAAL
jgi:putative SOS response-associated peptidase YedK